jgi:PAS domain S-box-containing protein
MKNRRAFSDIFIVIIILFLAIASIVSYKRITNQNVASNLVTHTNLVRYRLGQILNIIRVAENRQQDSIGVKDEVFNLYLLNDSSIVFQKLQELDSVTRDDKEQQTRIIQLKSLLNRWLENLHEEHTKAMNQNEDLSTHVLQGQTLMNRIQLLTIEMRHTEDELLLQKIQEKDRTAFLTPLYSLVFSFLAILIVTGAYFRLRIETRLRLQAEDSQAVIHNFFHQVPAMLAILKGPQHVFEFVNPSFRELIGGQNPINLPAREVVPEANRQRYFEILDKVYQTGVPYTGREMPLLIERGKDLVQVFITFICQALKNTSGETTGILMFCYDVSEQVRTRNQLQEAENRSRLAIEAARMGTFDWDLQNQEFISSERLVEIFGYQDATRISHQDLIDRFHPQDKPIRDEAVNNSFTSGSLKYEVRIIWPDKSIHWINVYGKIFTDDARNILRMYGTVVDITPQKIALEEIKESEAKFRLLANAMPQLIWTTDKNGNLIYFNQAVYDYSGLGFEELKTRGWLSIVHPDELKENIKKWLESVKTGNEFIIEHRFRNYKGEYRWQLSRAIPQKDNQGNIQMWIGTSTDIQEQKHFMQELERNVFERTQSLNYTNLALKQTVSELEQTNVELASFNYIASHDLQEPLRKIIAFSKRIEEVEKDGLTTASKDYFQRIINAASRMQNLIDAFLSYSQTSYIRAEFERLDLNKVLNDVKNDFAEKIEQEKITLESQSLPVLTGIPLQINQLFTNLIGNAIKYLRGNVDHKIEVLAEEVAGKDLPFEGVDTGQPYWKISIRDNGIGFDQIYENQIFEPFQRLHSRQEYAGTGIGLAICKKIMRNHKGFITATGHIGSGATFSMYFPTLLGS